MGISPGAHGASRQSDVQVMVAASVQLWLAVVGETG
jgi:hypothetical protein